MLNAVRKTSRGSSLKRPWRSYTIPPASAWDRRVCVDTLEVRADLARVTAVGDTEEDVGER
jgi:hypothetical protein